MERDEEGTYARVGRLRREVIEPRLVEQQGRLIKTTGDGFLAKGALAEARAFFTRAYEQDPEYGPAYAMAATTLMFEQGISGAPLGAEKRAEAIRLANLATRVASDDAFTLARAGHVLTYIGREYDRGASMVEQAAALNPISRSPGIVADGSR
jgi:tetratricopeptide (TPR) repeat protein